MVGIRGSTDGRGQEVKGSGWLGSGSIRGLGVVGGQAPPPRPLTPDPIP